MTDHLVPIELLRQIAQSAFTTAGLSEADAEISQEVLVRTSLRGVASHGMHGVPQYRRQLLEGGANPKAILRIEAQFGG